MGKLGDLLTGIQVLEEVESPINGKIKVVRGIAFGTYIQVEGLTQSGGILKSVWQKPLKKISNYQLKINNVLILGLGGGTVAGLVREFWPTAKITGVDLDPVMVELGKKYLNLDKYKVEVIIGDAHDYLNQKSKIKSQNDPKKYSSKINGASESKLKKYDLILIDLYVGREFPKEFESENYIHLVGSLLASEGVVIFNRLYYGEKRSEAVKFGNKLEKIFNRVDVVYPEANIMFICSR